MPKELQVDGRVRANLDHAWVYEGTEREGLMGRHREGVIIEVTDHAKRHGEGLVLVRWNSLTSQPLKRPDWLTHSSLIEIVGQ